MPYDRFLYMDAFCAKIKGKVSKSRVTPQDFDLDSIHFRGGAVALIVLLLNFLVPHSIVCYLLSDLVRKVILTLRRLAPILRFWAYHFGAS